jgi:hypothetical protein
MEWYWWIFFVVVALIVLQSVPKLLPLGSNQPAIPKLDDLRSIAYAGEHESAHYEQRPQLDIELKPYFMRLYRVHGRAGSFSMPETRIIGEEIHDKYGHDSMVDVHEEIRRVPGTLAAWDLKSKWAGIRDWRR